MINQNKVSNYIIRLLEYAFAITLILILNPYFIWDGYHNGLLSAKVIPLLKIMYIMCMCGTLIYLMINKQITHCEIESLLFLGLTSFIVIFLCGLSILDLKNISINLITNITFLISFLLLPSKSKLSIYKLFKLFFVISVIPGILYSILTFLRIDIPYTILSAPSDIKQSSYVTYIQYPFAVQITKDYDILLNLNRFRLCGIYDEPGRVGTLCALFLTSECYGLKQSIQNRILFVAGCLSLSVAFFVITFINYLCSIIRIKRFKELGLVTLIMLAFIVFLNIEFENVAISTFQQRFNLVASGLSGDNRTDFYFNSIFDDFIFRGDFLNILLGNGYGSMYKVLTLANIGMGSSYKVILYDLGYLGTFFYLSWVIYHAYLCKKVANTEFSLFIINVIVFVLNIYQRPTVFHPPYLIILFVGFMVYRINSNKSSPVSNEL